MRSSIVVGCLRRSKEEGHFSCPGRQVTRTSMGPTLDVHNSSGGFRSSIKASARLITNSVSTAKQDDLYEYPLNENTLSPFSPNRSSTSSRSSRRTSYFSRREASSSASLSHESDVSGSPLGPRYHILASTACPVLKTRTLETSSPYPSRPFTASAPFPHADLNCSSGSFIMATAPYVNDSRPSTGKLGTSQSNTAFGHGGNGVSLPPPGTTHNPHTVYQHIQNTASKRISTLDYLRKA